MVYMLWASRPPLHSPSRIVNYDPPRRRLRRWFLRVLVLRFEDILRGSGSLEAVRVSGFGLLLQS